MSDDNSTIKQAVQERYGERARSVSGSDPRQRGAGGLLRHWRDADLYGRFAWRIP